jgi:hypothetical protein
MLFWLALAVFVVCVLTLPWNGKLDEIPFFVGVVTFLAMALLAGGGSLMSVFHSHYVWSHEISDVHTYTTPDDENVYAFNMDNGKHMAVVTYQDSQDNDVSTRFSDHPRLMKHCGFSSGVLIPWTTRTCDYRVYLPSGSN